MSDPTRPVGTQVGTDGVSYGVTQTSPTKNITRAQMTVPPHVVVPIIFVPGIMGSNLRNAKTKESVWRTNSTFGTFDGGLLWQWAFRSAATRQIKLNPDTTEVDPTGDAPGKSHTVPDKDTAMARGWGTASKAFYGGFILWLDNLINSKPDVATPSPWDQFVGKADFGVGWGAQKSFETMTDADSKQAHNFFCPVHVVGYNWLQSNAEAGKYLAGKIGDIITYWQNIESGGVKPYKCEQVILVSHSMGGLVTRAAVNSNYGNAESKVLGIVHGEQPANGAAAAYHHVRNGYGGTIGWVLGRNAAQVTAVFANAPGALELLPNQQYPSKWLIAKASDGHVAGLGFPEGDPYVDIYIEQKKWWRLIDSTLIDPAQLHGSTPWNSFKTNLVTASDFHYKLGEYYHPQTYVHYGADDQQLAYGNLIWRGDDLITTSADQLNAASFAKGSGSSPVMVDLGSGRRITFSIADPAKDEVGDQTVPACSGEAPFKQGGSAIQQSFRMKGFDHQGAYDNINVQMASLYSVGKLLLTAKQL